MTRWGAVAARARGLVAGIRPDVAPPRDPIAGRDALVASGALPLGTDPDPMAVDRASARLAAARVITLVRWAARAGSPLVAIADGLEVEAVRALLRGAAGQTDPAERLDLIVPTPLLPRRVLERAARADSPAAVAAVLAAAAHPAGPLLIAIGRADASLRAAERALTREWGERAQRMIARRDAPMAAWHRALATAWTLWEALAVADGLDTGPPAVVPGAWPATPEPWAAARDGRAALVAALRNAGAPSTWPIGLAAALEAAPGDEEHARHRTMRQAFGVMARRDPVSSAPVVHALLVVQAARAAAARWAWRALPVLPSEAAA
jgi:hypothetical protein